MHIKNLSIVLMFITFVMMVLSAPVLKEQDDKALSESEAEDSAIDVTDGEFATELPGNESDSEVETESPLPVDDDFQLPTAINWKYTPEEVRVLSDKVVAYMKKVDQQIYAVPDEECTFENVIVPYGKLENELELVKNNIEFFQSVSPIKELRDASDEFSKKVNEYSVERSMDKKLYSKIAKVIENIENGKAKAPEHPEDQKLLKSVDDEFRNNGLALPDDKLDELKELQRKLNDYRTEFQRCVNEEEVIQYFSKEELEGLSDDFFTDLKTVTKDGKEVYEVHLDVPTFNAIRDTCKVRNTRKLAFRAYNQRCKGNIENMKQIVDLRLKIAKVLGFKTHADHVLQNKMAKTPENVMNFLNSLREKLVPIGEKEREKLVALKEEELKSLNLTDDGTFNEWDFYYYNNILIEKDYKINFDEVKEYFPMTEVTNEMLSLYQEIFSLRFEQVENPVVWHPDVIQLEVYDKESNDYIGTIYLDLYPREGKYNHFACFGLTSGFTKEDGGIVYPVGSLVTNFPKPTATKPSLMAHDDVVTYFHEFGHAIHQIVSRHKWARFNGFYVEYDFVEAPSQMNENFCWEKDILKRISHHYQDASKSLPDSLIDSIISTRNVSGAILNIRQIFFGILDMKIHYTESVEGLDTGKAYNDIQKEVLLYGTDDESWGMARFAHLVGGYDAGYYGYLYSQVFAADMYFSEFAKTGKVDLSVGKRYRQLVLEKGATIDAMEELKDFLGREPNDIAFIKSLGI